MYFPYGRAEVEYLKGRDKILAAVIDKVGHVDREVDTDLFSSVVHHIIGQQISTKAQATIWARMKAQFGEVNAESVSAAELDTLQSFGMTFRKAESIKDFAGTESSIGVPNFENEKEMRSFYCNFYAELNNILVYSCNFPSTGFDILGFPKTQVQYCVRDNSAIKSREIVE